MTTPLKDAQRRATVIALKEERARDGAQAMQEYQAGRLALEANTARLRALRLAKLAGVAPAPKTRRKASGPSAERRRTPGVGAGGPGAGRRRAIPAPV
jgi:hypothetical protein